MATLLCAANASGLQSRINKHAGLNLGSIDTSYNTVHMKSTIYKSHRNIIQLEQHVKPLTELGIV